VAKNSPACCRDQRARQRDALLLAARELRRQAVGIVFHVDRAQLRPRRVAALVPSTDLQARELVRVADEMLYEAKRKGRNRTMSGPLDTLAGPVTPTPS